MTAQVVEKPPNDQVFKNPKGLKSLKERWFYYFLFSSINLLQIKIEFHKCFLISTEDPIVYSQDKRAACARLGDGQLRMDEPCNQRPGKPMIYHGNRDTPC